MKALSIRHYIGWRRRAGFAPNGSRKIAGGEHAFMKLKAAGKERLDAEESRWQAVTSAVNS
jgi:hypothetical protein